MTPESATDNRSGRYCMTLTCSDALESIQVDRAVADVRDSGESQR
jgi:hypothetical protein